jgi:uncharacterized membrane protein YsdA (DUF1294 family)
MAVHETAAEPRASGTPARESTGRRFSGGAGVTAGAAVVAGALLLTRNEAIATLGVLTIIAGTLALLGTAAAVREWPFARGWTGPTSVMELMAAPMAWLAAVFAAVIVATNFLPEIVPAWDREEVFAVAIVLFAVLAVFGFGPRMTLSWPVGLRFSSLTLLGSVVALALVTTYLVFLILMRADATSADDAAWSRLVELRATLEALAFAGAGALLGTVVQRQAGAGERRSMENRLTEVEDQHDRLQSDLAMRDRQVQSLRSAAESAARQLTPDAPDAAALSQLRGVPARGSAVAVRRAREALLSALNADD